jgi:cell division septum initiation protein DivIVA
MSVDPEDAVGSAIGLRPPATFERALRGYERTVVDRYVAEAETRLAALTAELAATRARERDLAEQVGRLSAAVNGCTCAEGIPLSRQVGARIRRMLELAEEEAQSLVRGTERDIAEMRTAAAAAVDGAVARTRGLLDLYAHQQRALVDAVERVDRATADP